MRCRTAAVVALPFVLGCGARAETVARSSSLLRIGIASDMTICEGMHRFLGLSASWEGPSPPPRASAPPEITWMSQDPEVVRVESQSGAITGIRAGTTNVIVHGRIGDAIGRGTMVVTVLPGARDAAASRKAGELVCGSG